MAGRHPRTGAARRGRHPIYLKLQFENTAAYSHGSPLPHIVVVSTFLFVFPGGAGATLSLALLLLRSKSARLKKIAYAAIGPSLINTNEPLILGVPLVFNAYLAIPFLVAPGVLATTTYLAMKTGFVRAPAFYVPSSIPTVISVVLATFDWRALALAYEHRAGNRDLRAVRAVVGTGRVRQRRRTPARSRGSRRTGMIDTILAGVDVEPRVRAAAERAAVFSNAATWRACA